MIAAEYSKTISGSMLKRPDSRSRTRYVADGCVEGEFGNVPGEMGSRGRAVRVDKLPESVDRARLQQIDAEGT